MPNFTPESKLKGLDRPQITDPRVVAALNRVPRQHFVPECHRSEWCEDRAVPIGSGQTISQPFIVGLMTQSLKIEPGMKILEIGTGSGYQAAVLAELGANVYSIEIVPELYESASSLLAELGYAVQCRQGDGWEGWSEEAPFDAIIITACCPELPRTLISQLKPGASIVYPIRNQQTPELGSHANRDSSASDGETLCLLTRDSQGAGYSISSLGPVRFVPITRLR